MPAAAQDDHGLPRTGELLDHFVEIGSGVWQGGGIAHGYTLYCCGYGLKARICQTNGVAVGIYLCECVCACAYVQTKNAYEKASEEGERALHILEKADNDPNSTKAKIDKVTPHPPPPPSLPPPPPYSYKHTHTHTHA